MSRKKKTEIEPFPDFVEYLDEETPEKACISCVHNKRTATSAKDYWMVSCQCEIDGHYIGYCENYYHTCRYHELKEKSNG